jgi:hypothetical protein
MKSLFFFYILALGVFALSGGRSTFSYSFNATELNTTRFDRSVAVAKDNYVSIGFEIWETYQNYQTSDGYSSWMSMNLTSQLSLTIYLSSIPPQDSRTIIGRREPCGMPSSYNLSIVQEIQHFPSNLTVKGILDVIIEETLIPYLPYTENFLDNDLIQFTNYYGDQRYRTVKMGGNPGVYEKKDLVIQISPLAGDARNISSLIEEVIFATGDQCIWSYKISSEDRFVRKVPEDSGRSWNVTVPAKDLWYLSFVTKTFKNDFQVDYLLVDRPEPTPAPEPSSSYILCLDFNLIVVLILSILIFQK